MVQKNVAYLPFMAWHGMVWRGVAWQGKKMNWTPQGRYDHYSRTTTTDHESESAVVAPERPLTFSNQVSHDILVPWGGGCQTVGIVCFGFFQTEIQRQ